MEDQGEYDVSSEFTETQKFILTHLQEHHKGIKHAANRKELLRALRGEGHRTTDRHMREDIAYLRENGEPTLSTRSGGYFYAETPREIQFFIDNEIKPRTKHLHLQEGALLRHVHEHFGGRKLGE